MLVNMTTQEFIVSLAAWVVIAVLVYREARLRRVKGASPETWAIAMAVAGPIALPIFLHRRWQTVRAGLPADLPRRLPGPAWQPLITGMLAVLLIGLWGLFALDMSLHQSPPPLGSRGLYVSEEGYAAVFATLLAVLHGVAAWGLVTRQTWSTAWGLWLPLFDLLSVVSGDVSTSGWLPYVPSIGIPALAMAALAWPLRRRWLATVAHHV